MTFPSRMNDQDLETMLKAVGHYEQATGVPCCLLDRDGRRIAKSSTGEEEPSSGCRFCSQIRRYADESELDCSGVHRYGSYQAERFGGRYIYFCPNSMVHWVAPVYRNGEIAATFLGGPALMVDPEDFLSEDILSRYAIPGDRIQSIKEAMKSIPFVTPARTSALSELLYLSAVAVSSRFEGETSVGRNSYEGQARIAESIREIKSVYENRKKNPAYPLGKEKELLAMIQKGDRIGAQTILNEILGYIFFSTGRDLASIRIRVQELIVLLSRAAVEGGASIPEVFGLNDTYLPQLQTLDSVTDIAAWLSTILKRFSDCVFVLKSFKHADLIQKTVRFINANYSQRLTLESVASQVALSPSYFSRVFKDDTGKSFVEYLTDVRIEKSRMLLKDRNIPLVEIAGAVGFVDQSYFTKVFRRKIGVSPGRYRESGGLTAPPLHTLEA